MKLMRGRTSLILAVVLLAGCSLSLAQYQSGGKAVPRVIVFGVNGAEWDIMRPLLVRGELPNIQRVINSGVSARLKTVSAPNCPKVYSVIETSTHPQEDGITGFMVGGITANTNMLKTEPLWSVLSKRGVTVGMANVPATFPVMPVNGYMISGFETPDVNSNFAEPPEMREEVLNVSPSLHFNFDDDWITSTPIAELLATQRQKCVIFCWPWSAFIAHPFLN